MKVFCRISLLIILLAADVLVSITHAVPPYGVVGVNLYLADLLEDLLNYPSAAASSAKQGAVAMPFSSIVPRGIRWPIRRFRGPLSSARPRIP